jgi:hypothetical protein
VRIAVRGTDGERKWIGRWVSWWVIDMMTIYNDLASDEGQILPLVSGGLMDQPAREWQALRLIRAAYSQERKRQRDLDSKKSKTRQYGR